MNKGLGKLGQLLSIKVKGFTISEAIIAMVLTSLLVLLGASVIQNYFRLFYSIRVSGDQQITINLFQLALEKDTEKANKVLWDNNLILVNGTQTVNYRFEKDFIIRSSSLLQDTFKIKSGAPLVQFSPMNMELVESISVVCGIGELFLPVCVYKKYPLGLSFETIK